MAKHPNVSVVSSNIDRWWRREEKILLDWILQGSQVAGDHAAKRAPQTERSVIGSAGLPAVSRWLLWSIWVDSRRFKRNAQTVHKLLLGRYRLHARCGWSSCQEGCTPGETLLQRLNWQRASIAPSGNCAVDTSYVPTSVALFLAIIHHGRALASNCAPRADSIPHVWKCIWQRRMPESLSWLYLFVLFFHVCARWIVHAFSQQRRKTAN